MNASGSKLPFFISAGYWNAGCWTHKKRVMALVLLWLICALTMAVVVVVIEAHLRTDNDLDLLQQQNRLLQEALWQEQSLQMVSKQHGVYLGLLANAVIDSQYSEKASDVTHFVSALQNAALFSGWQHVQIGYSELQPAIVLDVQATVSLLSLSPFWLTLQDSGNLFDIQQLEFKAANRPGLYTVQLQLLPLQAGTLPPSTCLQQCLAPVVRQQKQKGFLLRSRNNSEHLTPLTSDPLGRVSAAKSESPGVPQ